MEKSELVMKLVSHCLFRKEEIAGLTDDEVKKQGICVDGIVHMFYFHPKRIEESKDQIKWLLNEMPAVFHKGSGGGMSFLNLCMDKHDVHWAEHPTMGCLISLGIAAGYARYCLPRDMWEVLPGGMPYVVFDTKSENEKENKNV